MYEFVKVKEQNTEGKENTIDMLITIPKTVMFAVCRSYMIITDVNQGFSNYGTLHYFWRYNFYTKYLNGCFIIRFNAI